VAFFLRFSVSAIWSVVFVFPHLAGFAFLVGPPAAQQLQQQQPCAKNINGVMENVM